MANQDEFLLLIKQNQAMVHKICYLYRDSHEDREDLFQEIVFQLWKAWPSFRGDAKATTWLYRIGLNTAVTVFRKKRLEIEYTPMLPDIPADEQNEEQAYRQAQLFMALKQLNDDEKAIIALYFEELSYKEIAEVTGLTENNVGVKLNRIKSKIEKIIIK